MRFFRHTIAGYGCTKRCGYHRSVISPSLSPFHVIAAATATVPIWIVTLREPWSFPWYYLFGIFAGELLLVFVAGFIPSVVLTPFSPSPLRHCRKCGAQMFFAGQHFDPLGSRTPHWKDVVIFVIFIGLNVMVWHALMHTP
jgi:hypothetical protein